METADDEQNRRRGNGTELLKTISGIQSLDYFSLSLSSFLPSFISEKKIQPATILKNERQNPKGRQQKNEMLSSHC